MGTLVKILPMQGLMGLILAFSSGRDDFCYVLMLVEESSELQILVEIVYLGRVLAKREEVVRRLSSHAEGPWRSASAVAI